MKVAIGAQLHDGPWGGGNQFASSLFAYLRSQGHDVRSSLDRPDLDVIVLTEPRRASASSSFHDGDVWSYLRRVNPNAMVVHRINECDERKGTRRVNRRIVVANRCADYTVFISRWLRDIFRSYGRQLAESSVVLNGADRHVFHAGGGPEWDGRRPLRVVTHHWSQHWNKGFDIYQRFDRLLEQPALAGQFSFTYIGRVPAEMRLRRTTIQPPLSGPALGDALRTHDVYLTASVNEPAGMHHIEGALSGLPVLYRLSGALPEYCAGFGLPFTEQTFESQLVEMHGRYAELRAQMPAYPNEATRMCQAYEQLFVDLLARREARRSPRRRKGLDAFRWTVAGWCLDTWDSKWTQRGVTPMREDNRGDAL
jgi:hypothetical protein